MIIHALIIFLAIGFGYLLRDGNIKAIEKKNKKIVEELKKEKGSAELLEYQAPITEQEEAEKQAKENMYDKTH